VEYAGGVFKLGWDLFHGLEWPNPRFSDNGNGTVTDNLTGLIWLKNANCDGVKYWSAALALCNNLADGDFGLTDGSVAGDWRLPNVKEYQSLLDFGSAVPGIPSGHPFLGVESDSYWTSTTHANGTNEALFIYMGVGHVNRTAKTGAQQYVWPVRGGVDRERKAAAVSGSREGSNRTWYSGPVEQTGQTTSYAPGDDGEKRAGMPWPNPRFADNNDGTVTDRLTNLIWLKNADCAGTMTWYSALSYCNSLAHGDCGLVDGSSPGDWRLPNVKELQSLITFGLFDPALPNTAGTGQWVQGDPFDNVVVQAGEYAWYISSTTQSNSDQICWHVSLATGVVDGFTKTSQLYVWPVRGGQED